MYINYNPNPKGNRVGDCTVRAISKALNQTWITTYIYLCLYGLINFDMPTANAVWGKYLRSKGYRRYPIENNELDYTVEDFCQDHPEGSYILAISGHVVAVESGNYFDTWDSGQCVVIFYWRAE